MFNNTAGGVTSRITERNEKKSTNSVDRKNRILKCETIVKPFYTTHKLDTLIKFDVNDYREEIKDE